MSPLLPGIFASGISGHLFTPEGSAYEIAQYTVPSGGISAVTLAIPSGYRHMEIHSIIGRTGGTIGQHYIRFNGDSSASYSSHTMVGNGSSPSTAGSAGGNQTSLNAGINGGSTANVFGISINTINDYASSSKNKTVRTLSGVDTNGAGYAWASSGAWYKLEPITSVTFIPESDSFSQNSTFTLIGYK